MKGFKYFNEYKTYDEIVQELEIHRMQQEAERKKEWDQLKKEFQLYEKRRIEKLKEARQRELEARKRELEAHKRAVEAHNNLVSRLKEHGVSHDNAVLYVSLANRYGSQYGIDRVWILAMMKTESNFNANAVSSHGAVGLMQMLPNTAEKFGISRIQLFNPETNVMVCVKYLHYLKNKFGSIDLATIAYNQGEGNVAKGTYHLGYLYRVKHNYNLLLR